MYLMQILNRMRYLEYSWDEIKMHLADIESREFDLEGLLDTLDVELPLYSVYDRAEQLIHNGKYKSFIAVLELRAA